jgi:ferredoxin
VSSQLRVNPIACDAHGLCAELFPERVRLDDWGYPIIDPRPIPRALKPHAKRAVDTCPTLALMLTAAEPFEAEHRRGSTAAKRRVPAPRSGPR